VAPRVPFAMNKPFAGVSTTRNLFITNVISHLPSMQ
jgi:hypothetical protein